MAREQQKIDIWSLFDDGYYSGTRMQPDKVKLTYEYKSDVAAEDFATLYIFGIEPEKTTPTVLASYYNLPKSTCSLVQTMATVIELKNTANVVDMFGYITGFDLLKDCHFISAVADITSIKPGIEADDTAIDCDDKITLLTFRMDSGAIYSYDGTVTLNHTYAGGVPTHYRVSMLPDLSDAEWLTYESLPQFCLSKRGINTVYLQLKDATDESNILSGDIGWSGWIDISTEDTFNPYIEIATNYNESIGITYLPEVRVSIGDDFSSDIGSTADYTEDTTKIQL